MAILLQAKDQQTLEFSEAFLQLCGGAAAVEVVSNPLGLVNRTHRLAGR